MLFGCAFIGWCLITRGLFFSAPFRCELAKKQQPKKCSSRWAAILLAQFRLFFRCLIQFAFAFHFVETYRAHFMMRVHYYYIHFTSTPERCYTYYYIILIIRYVQFWIFFFSFFLFFLCLHSAHVNATLGIEHCIIIIVRFNAIFFLLLLIILYLGRERYMESNGCAANEHV